MLRSRPTRTTCRYLNPDAADICGPGRQSAACAGRILIMAALPLEVRPFLRRVKARARRDLGLPAWNWEAGAAVVALSGMGAAAARRAGETLVERCRPELLVSVGFGGALTPGVAAGDLVLGETFWHYNPDTRELKAGPQPVAPRPLPRLCERPEAGGAHRGHWQSGHHQPHHPQGTSGRTSGRFAAAGSGPGNRRPGGVGRVSGPGLFEPQGHYRRPRRGDPGVSSYCRGPRGEPRGWSCPQVAGGRLQAVSGPFFPLAPEPRRRTPAGPKP